MSDGAGVPWSELAVLPEICCAWWDTVGSKAVGLSLSCPSLSSSIIPAGAAITTLLCSLTDDKESSRLDPSLLNVDDMPC